MGIDVEDITPRIQYVAAVGQTEFDYPFAIFSEADLVVSVDGALQALETDYTVEFGESEDPEDEDTPGVITFVEAMAGGEIVTIVRDTAIERVTDAQQNGPWTSAGFNDELDKAFVIMQEQEARVGRALRIPMTAEVDSSDIELDPANYANKYLTFDSDGKPTPADSVDVGDITQEIVAQALWPRTAAEQTAGVTPTNYQYEPCDVRRYGTNTTPGTTNMTTAIQNLAAVINAQGGGEAILQNEDYLYDGSALFDLADTRGVTIRGNGARFVSSQTNGSVVFAIILTTCFDTVVENLSLIGSNTTLTSSTGEGLINLLDGTRRTLIQNCYAEDCSYFLRAGNATITDPLNAGRVIGITVLNCETLTTYYPLSFQGNGDSVFVRGFKSRNAGRTYFPWNVRNHDVWVDSEHGGPFSDCLLKVYVDTTTYRRLENIKLNYTSRNRYAGSSNQNSGEAMINVEVQQATASNQGAAFMDNIDITFDVDVDNSPTQRRLFNMRRFDENGAADTTSRSHQFLGFRLSGVARSAQNFTEDMISLFDTGTWTGDLALNFTLEDIFLSGDNTLNAIDINGVPFSGSFSNLTLRNIRTDANIAVSGMNADSHLSVTNVQGDGYLTEATATFDPGSLADGAGETTTVTVSGAALGDAAFASFSNDLQGITLTAWVSASNTVSVRFQNESGGVLDLASGTLRVWLRKAPA